MAQEARHRVRACRRDDAFIGSQTRRTPVAAACACSFLDRRFESPAATLRRAVMKIVLPTVLSLLVTVCSGSGHVVVVPHRAAATASRRFTPPTIRSDVPLPSADFTTYLEGELVQVSVPSNWRELPGFNAVTFAPD